MCQKMIKEPKPNHVNLTFFQQIRKQKTCRQINPGGCLNLACITAYLDERLQSKQNKFVKEHSKLFITGMLTTLVNHLKNLNYAVYLQLVESNSTSTNPPTFQNCPLVDLLLVFHSPVLEKTIILP
ncbi:hypothetical protein EGR_11182 [Echinococcus granulosus]|uniref:Uncharacterized protein n=1 Tax=Echinococcus granulosus TaxID=6210 RepID=W6U0L0_ECHGR|nr:hypothetical protein EGR_11182 [Echinococcus granulosus]EUB53961.1 hypothetical protein EGR_11182 [Echinococcus granulosus]